MHSYDLYVYLNTTLERTFPFRSAQIVLLYLCGCFGPENSSLRGVLPGILGLFCVQGYFGDVFKYKVFISVKISVLLKINLVLIKDSGIFLIQFFISISSLLNRCKWIVIL